MVLRLIVPAGYAVVRMRTTPIALIRQFSPLPVSDTSSGESNTIIDNAKFPLEFPTSDSPYALIAAVLEAIPPLTGTETTGFNFTLLTGDLVAHDPDYQLSRCVQQSFHSASLAHQSPRAYNEYAEVIQFSCLLGISHLLRNRSFCSTLSNAC